MLNETTTQRNSQIVNSSPLMATAVKRLWDTGDPHIVMHDV